jgi:hypothetical protein
LANIIFISWVQLVNYAGHSSWTDLKAWAALDGQITLETPMLHREDIQLMLKNCPRKEKPSSLRKVQPTRLPRVSCRKCNLINETYIGMTQCAAERFVVHGSFIGETFLEAVGSNQQGAAGILWQSKNGCWL